MKEIKVKKHQALIVFIILFLFVELAISQRTINLNLEQLVHNAGVIVHGTVTKTSSGYDSVSKLIVTWVTISVKENFYGAQSAEFTFKQYGGRYGKTVVKLPDMPKFIVGEEVILMLTSPSRLGMQSPVGMQQGKFNIFKDKATGRKIALNGFNNRGLFNGVKTLDASAKLKKISKTESKINERDFAEVVRSMVKTIKTTEVK